MKKSTKVVLLSALVCPGTGHMALGRWWRGLAFMGPVLVSLGYITMSVVSRSAEAFDKILNGELSPDPEAIRGFLMEAQNRSDYVMLTVGGYLILVLWVLASIDAWRLAESRGGSDV